MSLILAELRSFGFSNNQAQIVGRPGAPNLVCDMGCDICDVVVEIIQLRVKRRQAYVTKYNLDACLIVIGHRLDTDELYNICHPNMYMKHEL